jgi:hypothetical protein
MAGTLIHFRSGNLALGMNLYGRGHAEFSIEFWVTN